MRLDSGIRAQIRAIQTEGSPSREEENDVNEGDLEEKHSKTERKAGLTRTEVEQREGS